MKRWLITSAVSLSLISCVQEEPASSSPATTDAKSTQTSTERPKFVTNSDNSRTYVSSITIFAKDIPSDARPNSFFGDTSQIDFYAEGENFIYIDEKSLVIDQLLVDGVDISKDRNLKLNTELGSFPKTSVDGKYAKWSVELKEGYYSPAQKLELSGRVTAAKSDELVELSSEILDIEDFESFRLGNVLVQGTRGPENGLESEGLSESELKLFQQAIKKSDELGSNPSDAQVRSAFAELGVAESDQTKFVDKMVEYMFLGLFSKNKDESNSNEISITIKTDLSALERIELYAGDVEIKRDGWFGGKDQRTYSFKKPAESELVLKVFYWQNPQQVKLEFNRIA